MATYMIDAVALLRYLVDELPDGADDVFTRGERGIDVLQAPDVQVAEALFQVENGGVVAGVELQGDPRETLRQLVTNGPVEIAPIEEHELAVFASEIDLYSMHDGLLAATHRVQNTKAIVTNDPAFASEDTIWR
jgi:predicted nucleic acid-binding protein